MFQPAVWDAAMKDKKKELPSPGYVQWSERQHKRSHLRRQDPLLSEPHTSAMRCICEGVCTLLILSSCICLPGMREHRLCSVRKLQAGGQEQLYCRGNTMSSNTYTQARWMQRLDEALWSALCAVSMTDGYGTVRLIPGVWCKMQRPLGRRGKEYKCKLLSTMLMISNINSITIPV